MGFPGKNTAVGCHFLFQGNFLAQGLNLHLLQGRRFFTAEVPGKPCGKRPLDVKYWVGVLGAFYEMTFLPKRLSSSPLVHTYAQSIAVLTAATALTPILPLEKHGADSRRSPSSHRGLTEPDETQTDWY